VGGIYCGEQTITNPLVGGRRSIDGDSEAPSPDMLLVTDPEPKEQLSDEHFEN
jgi:hypothetical protein